jgi:hypothetical protein
VGVAALPLFAKLIVVKGPKLVGLAMILVVASEVMSP